MVRLIPRDERYFEMLDELSGHLGSASRALAELFEQPGRYRELIGQIKAAETAADRLTQEIVLRLAQTFTTPFDAGDIHALAVAIDGALDLLEDAAESLDRFDIAAPDEAMKEMSGVLVQAGELIESAVRELRDPRSVREIIRRVWVLEEAGDVVYTRATMRLFADPRDVLETLKKKEMYDLLEETVDRCKDVAEVLESAAVKEI